jgi:hypothetical protein
VPPEGEVNEAAGFGVVLVRFEEEIPGIDLHHVGEAAAQAGDLDPLPGVIGG